MQEPHRAERPALGWRSRPYAESPAYRRRGPPPSGGTRPQTDRPAHKRRGPPTRVNNAYIIQARLYFKTSDEKRDYDAKKATNSHILRTTERVTECSKWRWKWTVKVSKTYQRSSGGWGGGGWLLPETSGAETPDDMKQGHSPVVTALYRSTKNPHRTISRKICNESKSL